MDSAESGSESSSDEEEGWGLGLPKSFRKSLRSASALYDSMLVELHEQNPQKYPDTSILTTPTDRLLHYKTVFVKFAKYIYDNDLCFGTCYGYVSTIKMFIWYKCPLSDVCVGAFYTNHRNAIRNQYVLKSTQTAKPLSSTSDPMTLEHLRIICTILFNRGSRVDAENRAITVVLWQPLGRINELGSLKIASISYYSNFQCLSVQIVRGKTRKVHKVLMFAHRQDMYSCPLHALGTHFALNTVADFLFVDLHTVEESGRINGMLRSVQKQHLQESQQDLDVRELAEKNYTSKSGRSGGSTWANEHPEVQTQDILPRGGWDFTGIQTIFTSTPREEGSGIARTGG